ncbi:hypothetical protein BDN72DRAFT_456508 [Pluteus cervinus]|uniref:Uncharacterized protein n=1 Tax=Pluteus cervinus TaxID=181527 RepID=A0ACD3B1F3_9AGAR|nr:hypothetical protein BDN72DRAFT_456508 [Pluteus cervinus]
MRDINLLAFALPFIRIVHQREDTLTRACRFFFPIRPILGRGYSYQNKSSPITLQPFVNLGLRPCSGMIGSDWAQPPNWTLTPTPWAENRLFVSRPQPCESKPHISDFRRQNAIQDERLGEFGDSDTPMKNGLLATRLRAVDAIGCNRYPMSTNPEHGNISS